MKDILQDLQEIINRLDDSRPYYEDKNTRYIFIASADFPSEYVKALGLLYLYSNVTLKFIDPIYIPDKNNVYIMEDRMYLCSSAPYVLAESP